MRQGLLNALEQQHATQTDGWHTPPQLRTDTPRQGNRAAAALRLGDSGCRPAGRIPTLQELAECDHKHGAYDRCKVKRH